MKKIKRYLYGDKRAPRWWQDHFEKTMLELGSERLESEPSCFVKKVTHRNDKCGCECGRSPQCWETKTSRQLLCATGENGENVELKRVEFIENGKSVLFLGDYITKFKDKITLMSKDTHVDNMLTMLSMDPFHTCNQ